MSKADKLSIVDDDELFREAIQGLIRSLGYADVEAFASAEDYLYSGRLGDTACLITDVQMPGMSGLELQKRLLADGYRTPVIFMSGLCGGDARASAMAAGATDFLDKPIDLQHLIQCLNKALSGG
jgi:FixJ family two-component response regulator